MLYDYKKQQELIAAREKEEREKARETLKNNSIRKNRGQAKKTIRGAKDLIKSATPWGILHLFFSEGSIITDWMYGLALIAAILKDILDPIEAAAITYMLVIAATFCVSIFIAMMMLLGSVMNGSGRRQQKIIKSWLILMGGTTAELLFGINFLPIETFTVLLVYGLLLADR